MRSPYTAGNPPPEKPPARLIAGEEFIWEINARRYADHLQRCEHRDPAACEDCALFDRLVVGVLVRGTNHTPDLARYLQAEAARIIADHVADDDGLCVVCTGRYVIPYPCWRLRQARRISPDKEGPPGQ